MDAPAGFAIEATLYQGGRSVVYRGNRLEDGASIVLKVPAGIFPTTEALERFRREYKIGIMVSGPNIIRYLDLVRFGHGLALVEEDLGGDSLANHIPEHGLDTQDFLKLAIQLVDGLSQIHGAGVMHKDIKPQNLVVNPVNGLLQIIDFGLSSQLDNEHVEAGTPNQMSGTLLYIAPEQTGRMNRMIDYRSDFYATGVTFYQLLCGRLPFISSDPLELIHAHMAREPEELKLIKPSIPLVLSQIVAKLMKKCPEDRYQSHRALKGDLVRCLEDLEEKQIIENFSIGKNDFSGKLRVPELLYGRDAEVQELLAGFERISNGPAEILMVSGYSGIGKSSLVREVHKPITARKGWFLSGKFDQLHKSTPYSALVQAFRQLCGFLLTGSKEQLLFWKKRLTDALPRNGRLLTNLIPELERVIGPQPELAQMTPGEESNRLCSAFSEFVKTFNRRDSPMVLFLDDLQWADGPTLDLLKALCAEVGKYFLLIGAYRDNEVGPEHPTLLALGQIIKNGTRVTTLTLKPLALADTHRLICDTFKSESLELEVLATLIQDRTEGNPFYINEFLKMLWHQGLLTFTDEGNWTWNEHRIRSEVGPENVVTLLSRRICKLSTRTRLLLNQAACLGNRFDIITLSRVAGIFPTKTVALLWPAVRQGLLVPLGNHQFWYERELSLDNQLDTELTGNKVGLAFLHDRVQQAAYEIVSKQERPRIHLEIGRRLEKLRTSEGNSSLIFTVVEQLNLGQPLIKTPEDRLHLLRLNLEAGIIARKALAFEPAMVFLQKGIDLLPSNPWSSYPDLTYSLYRNFADCDRSQSFDGQAIAIYKMLENHASNKLEIAELMRIQASCHFENCEWEWSREKNLKGLQILGVSLPQSKNRQRAQIREMDAQISTWFSETDLDHWMPTRELSRTEDRVVTELLDCLSGTAFLSGNKQLFLQATLKGMIIMIEKGESDSSQSLCAWFCSVMAGQFRYAEAWKLACLTLRLVDHRPARCSGAALNNIANVGLPYGYSLSQVSEVYDRANRMCLEQGSVQSGLAAITNQCIFAFMEGLSFAKLTRMFDRLVRECERKKYQAPLGIAFGYYRLMRTLNGHETPESFTQEIYPPETWDLVRNSNLLVFHSFLRFYAYFWLDHRENMLAVAEDLMRINQVLSGFPMTCENEFLYALVLYRELAGFPPKRRQSAMKTCAAIEARLKNLTQHCPSTFEHKYLILAAERSRVTRTNMEETIHLFRQAIQSAEEYHFIQYQALANQYFGDFWLERKLPEMARICFQEACYLYNRWGAVAVSELLAQRYPNLLAKNVDSGSGLSGTVTYRAASDTTGGSVSVLDLRSVIKATQAISEEITLERLLPKVMRAIIENAGAQKGCLLLEQGGDLYIKATASVEEQDYAVSHQPLEGCGTLPESVIRYSFRAGESIILPDPDYSSLFEQDSYLNRGGSRSILCMPLLHKHKILGVLYLENALSTNVFDKKRVDILHTLMAQTAISLDNARLYTSLETEMGNRLRVEMEIRRLNEQLEDRVHERTRELQLAQKELLEKARLAGMADIAVSILHNAGNVLNSVMTSAQMIGSTVASNKVASFGRANMALDNLIKGESGEMNPERWQKLSIYYNLLFESFDHDFQEIDENLTRILEKLDLLHRVIKTQEEYALGNKQEEILDLVELIHEAVGIMEPQFEQVGVRVIIAQLDPVKCMAQRIKLSHVINHIFTNALQAMRDIGDKEIILSLTREKGQARISIKDSGEGIERHNLDRIFGHGYTTRPQAHGFGLHSCANAMTEMGGRIHAESPGPGGGATFILELPVFHQKRVEKPR